MRFSCFYIYIISMNAEQLILTFYMNYVWCSRSRECLKFLIKAEESKMKWVEVITKLRYYDTWHQTTLVTKDTHVCVHTYRDACRVGDRVLFLRLTHDPNQVVFSFYTSEVWKLTPRVWTWRLFWICDFSFLTSFPAFSNSCLLYFCT